MIWRLFGARPSANTVMTRAGSACVMNAQRNDMRVNQDNQPALYMSGRGRVAVLLPGFAINW